MILKNKQLTALTLIYILKRMIANSYHFNQLVFVAILFLKFQKNELRAIKFIMGISNYTLKMADTNNYLIIINDNWKMTRPLNKLYSLYTTKILAKR